MPLDATILDQLVKNANVRLPEGGRATPFQTFEELRSFVRGELNYWQPLRGLDQISGHFQSVQQYLDSALQMSEQHARGPISQAIERLTNPDPVRVFSASTLGKFFNELHSQNPEVASAA